MKIEWKSCFRVAATVFICFLAIKYWNSFTLLITSILKAALPLTIGIASAYVINILMNLFENLFFPKINISHKLFKLKRTLCIILALITLIGIAAIIFGLVIPELISCIKLMISKIPSVADKIMSSKLVRKALPENIIAEISSFNWQQHISNIATIVVSGIGDTAKFILSTVSSVFSGIVTTIISIIITFYILFDKEHLKSNCAKLIDTYLPKRFTSKALYCIDIANRCFRGYIVGQCTEAVIIGVLCTITMLILRLPYAGMIGALIAFTALIPIAELIGAGVGALMILTESPLKALVFIIMIIILQQIEGNIIYPKVVGKSLGLPALWVLAAVIVGGGIAGIGGMLIGVPITATVYRIVREDVIRRSACSNVSTDDTQTSAIDNEINESEEAV